MSVINLKVKFLRQMTPSYDNIEEWIKNNDNVYIGRHMRIFVNKSVYILKKSIWSNPFKLKDYSLEECIEKYKEYILKRLDDPNDQIITKESLSLLQNKNLGCWCKPNCCHGDVLLDLIDNIKKN